VVMTLDSVAVAVVPYEEVAFPVVVLVVVVSS